jgi:SAM-dependent methyltransferase
MSNDPTQPAFWEPRYQAERMPWDFGGVPRALSDFLRHQRPAGRVLVPGCGSGYEVALLAQHGWDVTAIDFSPTAVERARASVGPALAERIVLGDFFAYPFSHGSFQAAYERTFLCALPPAQWPLLAARLAALLAPGALLFGFYFFGAKEDGPPFGCEAGEDERLFGGDFELLTNEPVSDSLPLFAGRERWQVRRRR